MNKYKTPLIVFAIFLLNLFLRLLPYKWVFSGDNIIFVDGDSYYHLRRILLIAENFPHIPVFDYYMNFPDGAKSPWPPLYDFFVASIAFIAGFGKPSVNTVEVVAAIIPPLLGALTVIPVYFLARRLFDEKIALWGSLFFSLIPGHIWYTLIGKPDHHAAEPLISTLFFLFFVISIYDRKEKMHIFSLLAGVTLSAGMLIWTGSIIYIAIAVFASTALVLRNQINGVSSKQIFYAISVSSLTGFLLISVYLLITDTWIPFNYIALSGFHAVIFLYISIFILALWVASNFLLKRNLRWFYLIVIALFASVLSFAFFAFIFPEFVTPLSDGIFKQIGKSVPWRRVISESRPLFSRTSIGGYVFSLEDAINMASWAILLVPIAFVLMLFEKGKKENKLFFILWSIPFLLLTLNQMRYIYYFSVNIGIATAYLMSRVMALHRSGEFAMIIIIASMTLFKPTLDKSVYYLKGSGKNMINRLGKDGVDTLLWLRDKTPRTNYFMEPGRKPEYGIMCTWSFGHEITYISQRPVVVNNFADVIKGQGYPDSLRYFTTTSVDESCSILERHGSRYVFTANPALYSVFSLKMAGTSMPGYFTDDGRATEKARNEIVVFRLYFLDGKDIGRYRLVYESAYPANSKYKIFEFVKGARIKGKTKPNSKVSVSVPIKSNQERKFTYENKVTADKDGVFEIILPYSTINNPYDVRAGEGYKLNINGKIRIVTIDEDAVLAGKDIYVR